MKKLALALLLLTMSLPNFSLAQNASLNKLKIVLIRHGEKPLKGDNLTCKGLNRSLALPGVVKAKFGIPNFVYVPAMSLGTSTLHSRMFQTVMPLVAKYNLAVNTTYTEKAYDSIATDLKTKTGLVLVVWEHKAIAPITKALGVKLDGLVWPDDDFDSIWIVTFKNGVAVLTKDKEHLKPSAGCTF